MTLITVVFNAVPPVAGFEVSRCIPFAVFVTDKEGFVILALAWVVVGGLGLGLGTFAAGPAQWAEKILEEGGP